MELIKIGGDFIFAGNLFIFSILPFIFNFIRYELSNTINNLPFAINTDCINKDFSFVCKNSAIFLLILIE